MRFFSQACMPCVLLLCTSISPLVAQDPRPDPDFIIQQDERSGLWGVVDADGRIIWPYGYERLGLAGRKVALGRKPGDVDLYVLGTQGRQVHVAHDRYWSVWRAAVVKSDIADRLLIVRVLDMQADPAARLKEVADMEQTYVGLAKVRADVVKELLGHP